MCGFTGLLLPQHGHLDLKAIASQMAAALVHRGPDDSGAWSDPRVGLALAHQRLSVLDLSPAGHQPMLSASGRYVIAFNGEIYNHLRLRRDLVAAGTAPAWRGHSDTETLLASIEAWGLEKALTNSAGMWAFALWDRSLNQLHLARDRFGEKPLYWGFSGSGLDRALVFGSELAALRAYPGFNNLIDRSALAQFLRFSYVPAPASILAGISKLPAGHLVSLAMPLDLERGLPVSRPWWQLDQVIKAGYGDPITNEIEAIALLEQVLSQTVSEQALADVPLGSFLSGGIDSSLITALLQAQSFRPVRTFTIGFDEVGYNEAPYAAAVSAHLGTDHFETVVTSSDARNLIPYLPRLYSEPFADASQLPTHLVCRDARRSGLTVALSGDGGDELFGGYTRYFMTPRLWSRLAKLPISLRRSLGFSISKLPPQAWDLLGSFLPMQHVGLKAHKLAASLRHVTCIDDLYNALVGDSVCQALLVNSNCSYQPIQQEASLHNWRLPDCIVDDPAARMMVWDALTYLPDDILVKVDRASMAVGLETRSPFLDHRVAAVAWRLPMAMKIRSDNEGTISKWVLRKILDKYLPKELLERPKAGFAIPIGQWLRGPLRHWAEQLLNPDRLRQEGYLIPEPIVQLWQQHLSGRYDHSVKLWKLLMWQSWLEYWG